MNAHESRGILIIFSYVLQNDWSFQMKVMLRLVRKINYFWKHDEYVVL